jgi:hypothetical protein
MKRIDDLNILFWLRRGIEDGCQSNDISVMRNIRMFSVIEVFLFEILTCDMFFFISVEMNFTINPNQFLVFSCGFKYDGIHNNYINICI